MNVNEKGLGVGKTLHFFYARQKVHAARNKSQSEKKLTPLLRKNFRSSMPQKIFSTYSLEFQKSQKIKLFVDFISKNVIRLSLYCSIYITFGIRIFESLERVCLSRNELWRGVGVHALFDFYKSEVYKND